MLPLKKVNISFEKKYKIYKRSARLYQRIEILSQVKNGEYLDPDDWKESEKFLPFVSRKYWNTFQSLCFDGATLIVKLSGLHYDPFLAKELLFSKTGRSNIIVHYHHWELKDHSEEDSFCLLECNNTLFKTLFHRFWFSPGCEIRFQGIVLKSTRSADFFRWFLRQESPNKNKALLDRAELVFDNLHNGFHFKVESGKKGIDLRKLFKELVA